MFPTSLDLIALAFGFFNVLRLASYFPQIVAVARDQNGATAISYSCWSIWIGANATTALYAWAKVGDAMLALISGFNALCCAAVLLLAIQRRRTCLAASRPLGKRFSDRAVAAPPEGREIFGVHCARLPWPTLAAPEAG